MQLAGRDSKLHAVALSPSRVNLQGFISAPRRIRTYDPRIRSPMLYPAELGGRAAEAVLGDEGALRPRAVMFGERQNLSHDVVHVNVDGTAVGCVRGAACLVAGGAIPRAVLVGFCAGE